jgi:UDP-N-acetyl-D-glucosamine dehydrogenase
VLIVGASYKPDVSDTRESPAIDIIDRLDDWNADVEYHDPHVPELETGADTYESVELTEARIAASDCVVLITDHSALDIDQLVENAQLLFDTRNATGDRESSNVVKL